MRYIHCIYIGKTVFVERIRGIYTEVLTCVCSMVDSGRNHTGCHTDVKQWSVEKQKDMGSRQANTNKKNTTYKRMLSVSDLLARTSNDYSQYFPRIDSKRYTSSAASAIYEADEQDAGDEINAYFGNTFSTTVIGSPSEITLLESTRSPSDRPHVSINGWEKIFAKHGGKIISDSIINHGGRSNMMSSKPFLLVNGTVSTQVYDYVRSMSENYVWFEINFALLADEKRLKVSMKQFVSTKTLHGDYGLHFMAKVCILPGILKKKQFRILDGNMMNSLSPNVCFDGISSTDFANMKISVKIYQRRGFFKRQKKVYHLVIQLEEGIVERRLTALININKAEVF